MTTLGLTGGIGSGKSAAAERFAEHPGVVVVNADAVGKRLMVEDPAVTEAVRTRFGEEAYFPDGRLNRAALAARVFADDSELDALNAIVHPAVGRALRAEVSHAEASGARLLVYESALLFETGSDALFDHVALVDAPEDVRIARAASRDGATPEAIRARMARQMDPAEARVRADSVLDNSGPLVDFQAQVDTLYSRLIGHDHQA